MSQTKSRLSPDGSCSVFDRPRSAPPSEGVRLARADSRYCRAKPAQQGV